LSSSSVVVSFGIDGFRLKDSGFRMQENEGEMNLIIPEQPGVEHVEAAGEPPVETSV
jgi:hypothetical protein